MAHADKILSNGTERGDFTIEDYARSGREIGGSIATDKEIYLNALRPLIGQEAFSALTKPKQSRSEGEERLAREVVVTYIETPCSSLKKHFYDVLPDDPQDLERFPGNLEPTGGDTSEFYRFAALIKFCRGYIFNDLLSLGGIFDRYSNPRMPW